MLSIHEELGEDYNSYTESTLINHPAWSNGNDFLLYTEHQGSSMSCDRKDKFVTIGLEGKTGYVTIDISIHEVDEAHSFFTRDFNGKQIQIPYTEKVTGTICGITYWNEEHLPDFFYDSSEIIGRECTAYKVDTDAMEKYEGFDLLYSSGEELEGEDARHEAAHERWNQFEENMQKLWELGYTGDFLVID